PEVRHVDELQAVAQGERLGLTPLGGQAVARLLDGLGLDLLGRRSRPRVDYHPITSTPVDSNGRGVLPRSKVPTPPPPGTSRKQLSPPLFPPLRTSPTPASRTSAGRSTPGGGR